LLWLDRPKRRFPYRTASSRAERALDRPAEVEGRSGSRGRGRGGLVVVLMDYHVELKGG
jgi:hypothetical protein